MSLECSSRPDLLNAGITDEVLILGLWNEGLRKEEEIFQIVMLSEFMSFAIFPKTFIFSIKICEWCIKVVIFLSLNRIDVIHAHSLKSLPVAVIIKTLLKCFLVYDAHEFETETYGLKKKFKKFLNLLKAFLIKFLMKSLTVSDSISKYYRNSYEKFFL